MTLDPFLLSVIFSLAAILTIATIIGIFLRSRPNTRMIGEEVYSRTLAWWVMAMVVVGSCLLGFKVLIICFALVSFQGLREYFSITKVRRADQRSLFWSLFVLLPLQYFLIWSQWYGMYVIFLPVYGFILIAIFSVLKGDATDYLGRTARIFFGIMINVYFISYIPALAILQFSGENDIHVSYQYGELVLFLIIVSQFNDVSQYIWGKSLGRHKITPHVSPNKTWEGFVGGLVCSCLLAALLAPLTPFSYQIAAAFGAAIAALGFAGDIVLSAIKRGAGIKDYGTLLGGHGGILDRIDGLAFASPIFFHLVRYYGQAL